MNIYSGNQQTRGEASGNQQRGGAAESAGGVNNAINNVVFPGNAAIKFTLSVVGDKWKLLIVNELLSGTKRFAELQRAIEGISQKMLTQQLRALEADHLLSRKEEPNHGLGLMRVKQIVHTLGGKLTLTPERDTFDVLVQIPCAAQLEA